MLPRQKVDSAEIKKGKQKFYIHCVAGDTKEHTYPNGKFQTDVSYEDVYDGVVPTSKVGKSNTPAAIEFIGDVRRKNSELNTYKIIKIIVYDKKRVG